MKIGNWIKSLTLSYEEEQLAFIVGLLASAAETDGPRNEKELQAIHRIAIKLSGGSSERLKTIWRFLDGPRRPEELRYRVPKHSLDVWFEVLFYILSVMCADGLLNEPELNWLARFKAAIEMKEEAFWVVISHYAGREDEPVAIHRWWEQLSLQACHATTTLIVSDQETVWRWMDEMLPGETVTCCQCGRGNRLPGRGLFDVARCEDCQAYLGLTRHQADLQCARSGHNPAGPTPRSQEQD